MNRPGLETLIGKMGDALGYLGGLVMVLMMLHIVADVAMSALFNDPLDGTSEIVAAYYMVAVVFLPLAFVTFNSGQLVAELFTSRVSGYRLSLFFALGGSLTLAYLGFLIYFTAREAIWRTAEGEAWETSVELVAVWPSRWFLPIGLLAMAICILYQTVQHLRGREDVPGSRAGEGF